MPARTSRWLALTAALSIAISRPPHLEVAASQTPPPPSRIYALLVGASRYPHLARRWWLEGPENDVAMIADLLTNQPFSVAPANIVTLTGWPQAVDRRPTRQNIESQFARLRDTVTAGDQVVVFMAGHGSQQPADPDPQDDEPDGLDELFLPADVTGWDGGKRAVTNAVVDDDIRRWVTAIRNRGAFVWLIVDSCQSGTMVRGNIAERSRQIPLSEFASIGPRAPAPQDPGQTTLMDLPRADAAGIVAIYASQPEETTPEKRLPSKTSPYHGLFTYTLTSVLRGTPSALTYRELVEEIVNTYRSEGRLAPTPMFEGGEIDRPILGGVAVMPDPTFAIGDRVGAGRRLAAGSIHGITNGTVVEIASLGFGVVTSVDATTAVVAPTPFGGRDAVSFERLPPASRARVVARGISFEPLRIVLQRRTSGAAGRATYASIAKGQGPERIEQILRNTGDADDVVTRTDLASEADWVLRVDNGEITLTPATGWYASTAAQGDDAPRAFFVGRLDDSRLGERLPLALRRIARARNLLKIAGSMPHASPGLVDIELLKNTDGSMRPVATEPRGRVLHDGDIVGFGLRNPSAVEVDVTVLHVTDSFGIEIIYPPAGAPTGANRLAAGERRTTSLFTVSAARVESEQVIAIGVPASDPAIDFASLIQPALEGSRGTAVTVPTTNRSPLQALLASATGAPSTRSLRVADTTDHTLRLLAWRVLPAQNATPGRFQ